MENCNKVRSPIVLGCKLVKNESGKAFDARQYKQMVGCLITRPSLAYFICLVARFMDRPIEVHVVAIKRIMRYVKGTFGYEIMYKHVTDGKLELIWWSNSDYVGVWMIGKAPMFMCLCWAHVLYLGHERSNLYCDFINN
jgi:hypothetical protein